jgi:hypothetical protein
MTATAAWSAACRGGRTAGRLTAANPFSRTQDRAVNDVSAFARQEPGAASRA